MALTANFASAPRASGVSISTANTNRDGTGTLGTVFAAGSSGSRVSRIVVQATGTTTAGMVRLFLHNGSTPYLWKEVPISAITPSASVAAAHYELNERSADGLLPLMLPSGWSLRASTHNAEAFVVTANGGDF